MNRRISSVEFRHEIRIVAYMKTKTNKIIMKTNSRIKTKKQTAIIAVTIMAALSGSYDNWHRWSKPTERECTNIPTWNNRVQHHQ